MSESRPYLVCQLHGSLYAVEAARVREIAPLPELTPATEAPLYIAGLVNFRGRVAPVMDLGVRLGYARPRYGLSDHVAIVEHTESGSLLGLIVNQVCDVRALGARDIEQAPAYESGWAADARFVEAVAKAGEELIMILDLERLMRLPETVEELLVWEDEEDEEERPDIGERRFCPEATEEERRIFSERAARLRQVFAAGEAMAASLVVVRLGDEFFGIGMEAVREFVYLPEAAPVPCSPAHILGAANLRGSLLTLVDIRAALGLPAAPFPASAQVVVVDDDELGAGVVVDEVVDVVDLGRAERGKVPEALNVVGAEYVRGTVGYGGRALGILDLLGVLRREEMKVDENPN